MKVAHAPGYEINIGPHVWPTAKYRLVRQRLASSEAFAFYEPDPATWDQISLVHTPTWVSRLRDCSMSEQEIQKLEIPWSPGIAKGFLKMTGGTTSTVRLALSDGVALHLGGGLHHAFPDHGEGFCPINDIAVGIRVVQQEGVLGRAAVIDCDVHQGNGTAVCFADDPAVFTFSIHQQNNYPVSKPDSDLDIGLRDLTTDDEYLERLQQGIDAVLRHAPECVVYVAGADPFADDKLGGLALTKRGLQERDRRVLRIMRSAGIPVAIVLAGGYADRLEDIVDIHVGTAQEALDAYRAVAERRSSS